jgi:hypothetical protein
MKVDILKFREIPVRSGKGVCVYGTPNEELVEWASVNGIVAETVGPYTNYLLPQGNVEELFQPAKRYDFVDGFSPNLNKHLHLGHLSNFVIARALQGMGVGKEFIAILGDTLPEKDVKSSDALETYLQLCKSVNYRIDRMFFASQVKLNARDQQMLKHGEGEYEGAYVFEVGEKRVVGQKRDGSTTYFYQDVALAKALNGSILYLTGFEQNEHFQNLKILFPDKITHMPLGLVTIEGEKMSSSKGNVIFLSEVFDALMEIFGSFELCWNVAVGHVLKSSPGSVKDIQMSQVKNPRTSPGLYLSYTLARLKSAGVSPDIPGGYTDPWMSIRSLRSRVLLQPNHLMEAAVEKAREISAVYVSEQIRDNTAVIEKLRPMASDMLKAMKELGMFDIDRV